MADPTTLGEQAKQNGDSHDANDTGSGVNGRMAQLGAAGGGVARVGGELAGAGRRITGRVLGAAAKRAQAALTADLDDRDPDYIRENLPLCWLMATLWYRAEVRNMGNVPEHGPVLLVGNHTGGNMSPGGDRAAARLHRPTSASSGPSTSSPTTSCSPRRSGPSCAVRGDGGLAQARRGGARRRRRGARLPRRRLGGPPALVGGQQDRPRRAQGVHQAGAERRRADRPGGHGRRPGDGALPQPRRLAGEADRRPIASCG